MGGCDINGAVGLKLLAEMLGFGALEADSLGSAMRGHPFLSRNGFSVLLSYGYSYILAAEVLPQEIFMTMRKRWTSLLLPLIALFGNPAQSAEVAGSTVAAEAGSPKTVIVVPVIPGAENGVRQSGEPNTPDEAEPPRAPRRIPEVRDPTRGMYDPETAREGDSRTLDQLSRDRLNLEGRRSRSLNDLTSPLLERRRIDQSRGRLPRAGERAYGTPSLHDRLGVQDSRKEYRIDSTREIGEDQIEENGSSDYRIYRTR